MPCQTTVRDLLNKYVDSKTPTGTAFTLSFTVPIGKTYVSQTVSANKVLYDKNHYISVHAAFSSNNPDAIAEEDKILNLFVAFLKGNNYTYSVSASKNGDVVSNELDFSIPEEAVADFISRIPFI